MPLVRRFTPAESLALSAAAEQARRDIDAELGDLMDRLARGDDSTLPAIYDRLAACGRIDQADRLKALVGDATDAAQD